MNKWLQLTGYVESWIVESYNVSSPIEFVAMILNVQFSNALPRLLSISSAKYCLQQKAREPTDDKSTQVQVMAWCRQATSHYNNNNIYFNLQNWRKDT